MPRVIAPFLVAATSHSVQSILLRVALQYFMFVCSIAPASPLFLRLPVVQVSAPLGLDQVDVRALSVQLHADDRPQSVGELV